MGRADKNLQESKMQRKNRRLVSQRENPEGRFSCREMFFDVRKTVLTLQSILKGGCAYQW